jgi:glycosyltransferase involved in cell wall biosynthesis
MPEISVIIPFYNREKSLRSAIQSVLDQDFHDFEIWAVDDGSTDSSCEIVQLIQDARVKLIKLEKNQGAQAARNAGIKAANSPWITFLDSDDVYLPSSLSSRYQFALKNNVQVVHSDCLIMRSEWTHAKKFGTVPLSGNVYLKLLQKPGPTFPGLFVAKAALEKIGYLDQEIRAYQEWDTAIRLAKEFEFGFLPEPTFVYQISSMNSISKNADKSAKSYLHIVKKYENEIIENCGIKSIANHYCSASLIFYRGLNSKDAKFYINQSLQINRMNIKFNLLSLIYRFGIKIPTR